MILLGLIEILYPCKYPNLLTSPDYLFFRKVARNAKRPSAFTWTFQYNLSSLAFFLCKYAIHCVFSVQFAIKKNFFLFQNLFYHHPSYCQYRIQLSTIKPAKFCIACHCFSVCVDDVNIVSTFVISFGWIEKNSQIGFQRSEFTGSPRTIKVYN